jgi:hypothetical protein
MKRDVYIAIMMILLSMGMLSLMPGEQKDASETVFYTIFGIVSLTSAVIISYFFLKSQKKRKDNIFLNKFYVYLEKNNYSASVIEFSVFAGLPPEKAREIIEDIAIKSGISPEIDENGRISYKFK